MAGYSLFPNKEQQIFPDQLWHDLDELVQNPTLHQLPLERDENVRSREKKEEKISRYLSLGK